MEAYAQDVFNRYDLGKKGLDIEEQKLIKDTVLGMLEIASKGTVADGNVRQGTEGVINDTTNWSTRCTTGIGEDLNKRRLKCKNTWIDTQHKNLLTKIKDFHVI